MKWCSFKPYDSLIFKRLRCRDYIVDFYSLRRRPVLSCVRCACREMKKGNIGMTLGMIGKKLRDSMGSTVDLGLTGKDGVVHPSLAVRRVL